MSKLDFKLKKLYFKEIAAYKSLNVNIGWCKCKLWLYFNRITIVYTRLPVAKTVPVLSFVKLHCICVFSITLHIDNGIRVDRNVCLVHIVYGHNKL